MTYKDFIDRVNDKVRVADDWPASANAIQEQVDLSYLAAISVATEVPLSSFSTAQFENATLAAPATANGIDQYTLPGDMFRYRNDLGIATLEVGSKQVQHDEAIALTTLRRLATNLFYKDHEAPLFAVNLTDRRVYVVTSVPVKVNYLKEFVKPALGDVTGATPPDYPFEGIHAERAASIVATHVQGEKSRDSAAAQFQALLQRQYTAAPPPALQTSEPEQ